MRQTNPRANAYTRPGRVPGILVRAATGSHQADSRHGSGGEIDGTRSAETQGKLEIFGLAGRSSDSASVGRMVPARRLARPGIPRLQGRTGPPVTRVPAPHGTGVVQADTPQRAATGRSPGSLMAGRRSPRISIIMPVYNVREDWLRQAISSVIAQTYPHWELVCINDASPAPHIRPVLDEMASRDSRIVVIHSPTNKGVSSATNTGIEDAKSDHVLFMDHDDHLEPNAACIAGRGHPRRCPGHDLQRPSLHERRY